MECSFKSWLRLAHSVSTAPPLFSDTAFLAQLQGARLLASFVPLSPVVCGVLTVGGLKVHEMLLWTKYPLLLNHNLVLPRSRVIEVPHINQQYNWDCGLACVLMVLQTIGIDNCNLQALEKLCGTKSIWTVDLAYLLRNFSVIFSYFTVTLGANPKFSVETFYKDQLPHDLVRVDLLFQKAFETGITIECRSFSREELSLLILSGKYVAIALVDQYKLIHSWLEDVSTSDFYGSNLGYTGHYVVICGYDTDTNEFEIRDPACSRKCERVSAECLDEARKSFGTDEDLLLISLAQRYDQDTFNTSNNSW